MCGRFKLSADPTTLYAEFGIGGLPEDYAPRYNIAPTQPVLSIVTGAAGWEAMHLRWGLVPAWARETKGSQRRINARAETLNDKPAFRDAFQRRVALQHARENAFGHDLDARAPADASLHAHAVTDGFTRRFAERARHARCHRAGREPPRLEHHDLSALQPRFTEQRNRHNGALARAGWRFNYRIAAALQRRAQCGQYFVDGQTGFHEARIIPRVPLLTSAACAGVRVERVKTSRITADEAPADPA